MCGRYTLKWEKWSERMLTFIKLCNQSANDSGEIKIDSEGDIRPGDIAPGLIASPEGMRAIGMRWGFDCMNTRIINARSEDVEQRPLFRGLLAHHRCALPASGYFEWRSSDHQKYVVRPGMDDAFYLAGLYQQDKEGMLQFVVLTRAAFGDHAAVHHRMPVVLQSREEARKWLRGALSLQMLTAEENAELSLQAVGAEQLRMLLTDQSEASE